MPPRHPGSLLVKQIPVGPMANFVYLAVDEGTKESMVVDSGWEVGPLVAAVRDAGAKVKYVVATHGHFDHVSTIRELADEVGGQVVAHRSSALDSDLRVEGGDELKVGRTTVKILPTPGHTEDSICLYDGKEVFTGDTLFVGTIGKFDRSNAERIFSSLYDVLGKLPGKTMVYPGHDYGEVPCRTLEEEFRANPFLGTPDLRMFLSLFS